MNKYKYIYVYTHTQTHTRNSWSAPFWETYTHTSKEGDGGGKYYRYTVDVL